MTDLTLALASRQAVGLRRWRWTPGMLTREGQRLLRPRKDGLWVGIDQDVWAMQRVLGLRDALPDLSDPATLGCLLALVREAWEHTDERPVMVGRQGQLWVVTRAPDPNEEGLAGMFSKILGKGATEAEALVAALEAAP